MEKLLYHIDMSPDSRWEVVTPSVFAKEKLLYMQEVGHFISGNQYYTVREGLNSYLIKLTLSGKGILEYCGEKYTVTPGRFFLIDCRAPQKYYTDPEIGSWDVAWVHFYGATAEAYYEAFLRANRGKPVSADPSGAMEDTLMSLLDRGGDTLSGPDGDIAVSALLTRLLATAVISAGADGMPGMPEFVREAEKYLNAHQDEPVSLERLAKVTNVSKFHLQREFTRYFGVGPAVYLKNLRLNRGKELLRGTGLSVGEIATKVGMEASYFVQCFRKNEGITPGEYRKKWR